MFWNVNYKVVRVFEMVRSVKRRVSNWKKNSIFRGHVDSWDGKFITGWAVRKDKTDIELCILGDGKEIEKFSPKLYRKDLFDEAISDKGIAGYNVELSAHDLFKNDIEKITVVETETGNLLTGGTLIVTPPNFKGYVDYRSLQNISGWVFDQSYPLICIEIDVYINNKLVSTDIANQSRHDLESLGLDKLLSGFSIDISKYTDPLKLNTITLKLAKTNISILDDIVLMSTAAKVDALLTLQNQAKEMVCATRNDELNWLVKDIIPTLIDQTRNNTFGLGDISIKPKALEIEANNPVDIIIPVYKGLDETINCIQSVYGTKCLQAFNVIVINDCSPEPELTSKLRQLSKNLSFTLIENETNLGFVGTVNKGMKRSVKNDVILLNSDTVVTNYWLDNIVTAAYSSATIATVTPFSNNATICSYPKFCVDNELPTTIELDELSAIFGKVNKSLTVDLPTAHGFSMFIKRAALNEVGFFDEQKWGKGYAEENDFSLRATRLGWRNVMATDAFVHHLGAVSFAGDSDAFIATNLEKLNGMYPDYPEAVQSFIKSDPIRPYRNNVALALMQREIDEIKLNGPDYSGSILFISLTIGGGTQVATDDLAKIHKDNGKAVFMLKAPRKDMWELHSQVDNSFIQYQWPEDKALLINNLKLLLVGDIHYHHTIEFNEDVWDLPKELDVPYDITLHDYYTICPRVNLIDSTQVYCGEPKNEACNRCIKKSGVHASSLLDMDDLGGSIETWREYFFEKLKCARTVITPSNDTKGRIQKYFDLDNIETRYHPEAEINYQPNSLEGVEIINIAFIGAIGVHKGLNILKECAQYAYKFDLPVKFTVIGYTENDKYFDELPNVLITGKYKKEELPSLLKTHDCHVAGLFSVWPETYSYTLSEAMRANLRIACFELGAVSERVALIDKNIELFQEQSPQKILKQILGLKEGNV
jgi:GT2 family glycosyltransferase